MNRYRNAPGVRGPSKATATTLCQKCLKRDIYECKATAQERPYVSRPSRTQQLQNPELVPKLKNEAPTDLTRTDGLADEILAKQERERGRKRDFDDESQAQPPKRPRSMSSRSSSVSTISTDRSRSRSPEFRTRYIHSQNTELEKSRYQSPTDSSRQRKRRYSDDSLNTSDSSASFERGARNLSREAERNTRRKRREYSPTERGRRRDSSTHGNRRDKSESQSRERSRIARQRRSMTPNTQHRRSSNLNQVKGLKGDKELPPQRPRERSLSPFSKRLALTQAMNMGR